MESSLSVATQNPPANPSALAPKQESKKSFPGQVFRSALEGELQEWSPLQKVTTDLAGYLFTQLKPEIDKLLANPPHEPHNVCHSNYRLAASRQRHPCAEDACFPLPCVTVPVCLAVMSLPLVRPHSWAALVISKKTRRTYRDCGTVLAACPSAWRGGRSRFVTQPPLIFEPNITVPKTHADRIKEVLNGSHEGEVLLPDTDKRVKLTEAVHSLAMEKLEAKIQDYLTPVMGCELEVKISPVYPRDTSVVSTVANMLGLCHRVPQDPTHGPLGLGLNVQIQPFGKKRHTKKDLTVDPSSLNSCCSPLQVQKGKKRYAPLKRPGAGPFIQARSITNAEPPAQLEMKAPSVAGDKTASRREMQRNKYTQALEQVAEKANQCQGGKDFSWEPLEQVAAVTAASIVGKMQPILTGGKPPEPLTFTWEEWVDVPWDFKQSVDKIALIRMILNPHELNGIQEKQYRQLRRKLSILDTRGLVRSFVEKVINKIEASAGDGAEGMVIEPIFRRHNSFCYPNFDIPSGISVRWE